MDAYTFSASPAYNGDQPYIFISYAHKDAKTVLPAIEALQARGLRIWFDMGIEAGTEWSNNIAAHLRDCSVFVAFISQNSVRSENCLDEIAYAKSHRKASLMIFLEDDVVLPEGTEMQTARFQRMFYSRQASTQSFAEKLCDAPILAACRGEDVGCNSAKIVSQPIKKKTKYNLLWIGLAAAAVVLALILVLLLSGGDDISDETQLLTTQAPETTDPTTEAPAEVLELSDDPEDFTFRLQGVVYKLPLPFATLVEAGWTISSNGETSQTLVAGLSDYSFTMVKDGHNLEVAVFNPSGNVMPIADCLICKITVYAQNSDIFQIAGGIAPGASVDEIIAAFGVPANRSDYSDYSRLSYTRDEYSDIATIFCCYTSREDQKYSFITLKNFIDPNNTATETNTEVPEYLGQYVAPTELGEDPTTGIVQIEGDLYQLPAPLQVFLDNGWTLSTMPGAIPAGNKDSVRISRDGKSIDLSICNFADYQTIAENCAVVSISAANYNYSFSPEERISLVLPGGIALGMSREEVAALVPSDFEMTEYTNSVNYSFYDYEGRYFSLYLDIDLNDDYLQTVIIKWDLE